MEGELLDDNNVLIDVLSTHKVGGILLPWIFMSDGIHHSNFAGDKQLRPVYITTCNLTLNICQMPSMHIVVMVAHPPITINNNKILPEAAG